MSNNATYKQLQLVPTDELTEPQKLFLSVHNEIVMAGQKAAECVILVANDLQRMRDEELYKAAGFESFPDYVKNALNIEERQAYNWISVLKLPKEYLTAHAGMGVSKLALIASASDEVAQNLMEDESINAETKVNELKAIIKEQEAQLAEQEKQLDLLEGDLQDKDDRIRELENAPIGEDPELKKAIEAKEQELAEANRQISTLRADKADLQSKLNTAKAKAKEVKTVPDEESKKLAEAEKARADELEQKLRETNAQLAAAKEQKKTIASDDLLIFKVKFGDLQRLGEDIKTALAGMSKENATKCRNAVNALLDSWKEEMQL